MRHINKYIIIFASLILTLSAMITVYASGHITIENGHWTNKKISRKNNL